MSDKDNKRFFSLIEENWKKFLLLAGITAGVVQVIPKVQENLELYIFAFFGVVIVVSISACVYYGFFWQSQVKEDKSVIFIPRSGSSIKSQKKKESCDRYLGRLQL